MITGCRKCGATIARWTNLGLQHLTEPQALTAANLARAWLNGQHTYRVRTLTTRQWTDWYPDNPANRRQLAHWLTTSQPIRFTILPAHTCPGHLIDPASALDTWQPDDRAYHQPKPRPAATEGIPF
jgi:hypothetical protein